MATTERPVEMIKVEPSFVKSKRYAEILQKPYGTRHGVYRRLGAWRWPAVFEHRYLISNHVFDADQVGIDFGGWQGPIGGFSTIIDIALGNSLDNIRNNSLDYIFTSHTLEHVNNIIDTLMKMCNKLKDGGKIMIHVPSYKKGDWRALNDKDHNYTFMLSGTKDFRTYELDTILHDIGFDIIIAKYTGDWGIFIYGQK
jgi:SAM-dependent methyltransferase